MGAKLSHKSQSSRRRRRTPEWYFARICVIGERGTGKMSLADRFTKNQFGGDETDDATVRVRPWERGSSRLLKLDGNNIEMTVSVHTDSDKFDSSYGGMNGVLVVYSVTDKWSFERLSWWIGKVKCNCGDDIPIVLVGNKCDDVSKTVVDFPTAWDFATEKNLPLIEVSAKDGTNVELAFVTLLSKIRLEQIIDWMLEAVVH